MLRGMRRTDYFAEAIKVGRAIRGLSVPELSRATGIPTWLLRGYESGKSKINPETFLSIWHYLSTGDPPPLLPSRRTRGPAQHESGLVAASKSELP
jgi:hypothetical protein